MGHTQRVETPSIDEQMLQAWEDMRIEILHDLQDGASADIPDTLMDDLGNLMIVLAAWRAERRPPASLSLAA